MHCPSLSWEFSFVAGRENQIQVATLKMILQVGRKLKTSDSEKVHSLGLKLNKGRNWTAGSSDHLSDLFPFVHSSMQTDLLCTTPAFDLS